MIVELRGRLSKEGHDCGARTIAYHLACELDGIPAPSVSTIWRILRRKGLVVPQPQKRPRSSLILLPSRTTERDVADRHHPLGARERLELRRLEYELLLHLAGNPNRVFRRQELLRAVWGFRSAGTTRTVDSHASRLRSKLSAAGESWVISERGVGYRLLSYRDATR